MKNILIIILIVLSLIGIFYMLYSNDNIDKKLTSLNLPEDNYVIILNPDLFNCALCYDNLIELIDKLKKKDESNIFIIINDIEGKKFQKMNNRVKFWLTQMQLDLEFDIIDDNELKESYLIIKEKQEVKNIFTLPMELNHLEFIK